MLNAECWGRMDKEGGKCRYVEEGMHKERCRRKDPQKGIQKEGWEEEGSKRNNGDEELEKEGRRRRWARRNKEGGSARREKRKISAENRWEGRIQKEGWKKRTEKEDCRRKDEGGADRKEIGMRGSVQVEKWIVGRGMLSDGWKGKDFNGGTDWEEVREKRG
jgi:hypothetical protein